MNWVKKARTRANRAEQKKEKKKIVVKINENRFEMENRRKVGCLS